MKTILSLSLLITMLTGFVFPVAVSAQRRPNDSSRAPRVRANVTAQAVSDGRGAFVTWRSRSEAGVLGYELFRWGSKGRERVTETFFEGGGLRDGAEASEPKAFSFFDAEGGPSTFYQVESIHIAGFRSVAASTVAQQVLDIEPIAGHSSEDFFKARSERVLDLETSRPRYPKALAAEMALAVAPPDPTRQFWIAGQPGVKISVKQTGIYRVTRSAVQAAGFNVSASTKYWRLFADGNEVAIRMAPDGSFFEFYGEARDTRESDTRVYYLIADSTKGRRMTSATSRPVAGAPTVNTFPTAFSRKYRTSYFSTLLNGDAENFFGALVSTTPADVPLAVDAIDSTQPNVNLEVRLQGISALPHSVNVFVNGTQVGTVTGNNRVSFTGTFSVPASTFVDGNNTIRFTSTLSATFSYVDTITLTYQKRYTAASNRLSYLSSANKQVTVGGFTSSAVSVYDLTDTDSPEVYNPTVTETQAGVFSATVNTMKARALFAVADSAKLSPFSIEANTPSNLSGSSNEAQLLIVTHKNFTTEANAWATYRRGQGLNVKVVDVEDVFDEFSYGSAFTEGLRSFFSYAKQNWTVKPDYVLLVGDGSYDYRGYMPNPSTNFIPTRLFDTLYEETGTDDALVDFNNDGLAEIPIGRIPAQTGAFITQVLTKTQTFETTVATALATRGVSFASDQPDGYDFAGLNVRLAARLPAGTPTQFVTRSETDARTKLLSMLNGGRMLVNYSGHGSSGLWAASSFFTLNDASALTNGSNLTVFMMLTCLNGYFIMPNGDSLAESALKANNGGAPAAWASTGKTTPDVQDVMANRFFTKLAEGSMPRIGDLIRDSKTVIAAGRDVRLSWVLLGDPTMRIR